MIAIPKNSSSQAPLQPCPQAGPCRLAAAAVGRPLRVASLPEAGGDTERLRAMGLCVGRRVELVQAGSPAIVRLVGARVGISAQLAEAILVEDEEFYTGDGPSLSDVA